MDTKKYSVVMFPKTGAIAICDFDIQVPDSNKIYAYSFQRNLMRIFNREVWGSAVKITGDIYDQAVMKYLAWIQGEGKYDDEFQDQLKKQSILIEEHHLAVAKRKKEIRAGFSKHKVKCLWHMTHKRNIENIIKCGILNNFDVHNLDIKYVDISDIGAQRWREKKKEPCYNRKIHDYVPLYINPQNPMLYALREQQNDLCLLEVLLDVVGDNEFVISDGNVASRDTKFSSSIRSLDALPWDILNARFWADFPDGKRKRCAEVLVYPEVQPMYIGVIHCYSVGTAILWTLFKRPFGQKLLGVGIGVIFLSNWRPNRRSKKNVEGTIH